MSCPAEVLPETARRPVVPPDAVFPSAAAGSSVVAVIMIDPATPQAIGAALLALRDVAGVSAHIVSSAVGQRVRLVVEAGTPLA